MTGAAVEVVTAARVVGAATLSWKALAHARHTSRRRVRSIADGKTEGFLERTRITQRLLERHPRALLHVNMHMHTHMHMHMHMQRRRDTPGSCRARSPALHVGRRERVASSWRRLHAH